MSFQVRGRRPIMYVHNTVYMVNQGVPQEIQNITSPEPFLRSTAIARTFANASDYFQNLSEKFGRFPKIAEDHSKLREDFHL